METIFIYFLKASGLIITFFAAYYFLLRKETFFRSNRWFLLSGLILSVILPLFFIKKVVLVEVPKVVPEVLNTKTNTIYTNEIIEKSQEIDWFQIGFYVYGIIAVFFLLKIIFNLISLYKILDNKIIIKESKFQFIDTDENVSPFSFFNYIVFNSSLYSESELKSILLHEKIHSSQKHSLDVILTNLFSVVFWFNPFMYLYKKAVIQNLEYIADNEAVNQLDDARSYQMALLKVVSNQNCLPITNHFYQSLIKKRIIMLNKNQSHRKNSWKYAVVLPALIAFVFLFQVKVIAQIKSGLQEDGSSISKDSREVADYLWTKNCTDEQFKKDSDAAMASGIVFDFSDILRNSKGEITNITVSYSDNLGNVFDKTFSDKKGIEPIHFVRDIDFNGKGSVGFTTDKKSSDKIQNSSSKDESYSIGLDSNDADEVWSSISKEFTDNGITTTVSDIKRNSENKIIAVSIVMKSENGIEKKMSINQSNPIKAIELYYKSKSDFGIRQINNINDFKEIASSAKNENVLNSKSNSKDDSIIKKVATTTSVKTERNNVNNVITQSSQERKYTIFSNDNGDDIVFIPAEKTLKLPGYPSVNLIQDDPLVTINGVVKSNPLETLNQMDLHTIKSIRVQDENGKETPGSKIKKVIIITK